MFKGLFFLIFIFLIIILYSQIKLLYCIFTFLLLLYLIWISYRTNNRILLITSLIFLILLLPSLIFYLELSYMVYPYLFYETGKQDEMKEKCNGFLRRQYNLVEIGKETLFTEGPVIYLLNHHTSESKLIDYFATLTINSEKDITEKDINSKREKDNSNAKKGIKKGINKTVVTGGETRWNIIDNLYSNLDIIKLNKEKNGNLSVFLQKSKEELEKGNNLIIFPEGKYSNKKNTWRKLENFQSGAFILSKQTNIPIVPVLISGNNHQYGFKTNSNLIIKYLSPLYPEDFSTDKDMKEYCLNYMNEGLKII